MIDIEVEVVVQLLVADAGSAGGGEGGKTGAGLVTAPLTSSSSTLSMVIGWFLRQSGPVRLPLAKRSGNAPDAFLARARVYEVTHGKVTAMSDGARA